MTSFNPPIPLRQSVLLMGMGRLCPHEYEIPGKTSAHHHRYGCCSFHRPNPTHHQTGIHILPVPNPSYDCLTPLFRLHPRHFASRIHPHASHLICIWFSFTAISGLVEILKSKYPDYKPLKSNSPDLLLPFNHRKISQFLYIYIYIKLTSSPFYSHIYSLSIKLTFSPPFIYIYSLYIKLTFSPPFYIHL